MVSKLKALDRNDYKPLYAQLGDNLIEYIESNGLKPGDPIQSENELIKYCGVSSLTVRLAMQRLATEGIINRIQGKGTFVADRKIKAPIKGVHSLEKRLENQGIQIKNVFIEAYEAHPTRYHRNALNLPAGAKDFKVRRLLKIGEEVLGIETRHFPLEVAEKFDPEAFKTKPFVELLNRYPETSIYRISYRTKSSLVLKMEAKMMDVPFDSLALVQYGIFYNKEDIPVMSGRITYLSEKLELEYEVHRDEDYSEKVLI
jgi:GntR family transcriptional regulator